MNKYECSGYNAVQARSMKEAAETFAARAARREFGKAGYCRICRMDSWSEDGTRATFDCFIGYSTGQGQTTGHNIWLTVDRFLQ
jgi:hypothetical protein